jgi:hypothetical protein
MHVPQDYGHSHQSSCCGVRPVRRLESLIVALVDKKRHGLLLPAASYLSKAYLGSSSMGLHILPYYHCPFSSYGYIMAYEALLKIGESRIVISSPTTVYLIIIIITILMIKVSVTAGQSTGGSTKPIF